MILSKYNKLPIFLLFAIFLLASLYPVYFYCSRTWKTASPEELNQLCQNVKKNFNHGDLIITSPWYFQRPYMQLGKFSHRILRQLHPDDLLPYQRVHLIELSGAPGEGVAQTLKSDYSLIQQEQYGPIFYGIFTWPKKRTVLYDFYSELKQAQVFVTYANHNSTQQCRTWNKDRWICPRNQSWNFVGQEYLDYDNVPRPLIWAHPVKGPGSLRIQYSDVPRGDKLIASHAFTRWASKRARSAVVLTISIEGQPAQSFELLPGLGLRRFKIDIAAGPPQMDVSFSLHCPDNGAAHYGFKAFIIAKE